MGVFSKIGSVSNDPYATTLHQSVSMYPIVAGIDSTKTEESNLTGIALPSGYLLTKEGLKLIPSKAITSAVPGGTAVAEKAGKLIEKIPLKGAIGRFFTKIKPAANLFATAAATDMIAQVTDKFYAQKWIGQNQLNEMREADKKEMEYIARMGKDSTFSSEEEYNNFKAIKELRFTEKNNNMSKAFNKISGGELLYDSGLYGVFSQEGDATYKKASGQLFPWIAVMFGNTENLPKGMDPIVLGTAKNEVINKMKSNSKEGKFTENVFLKYDLKYLTEQVRPTDKQKHLFPGDIDKTTIRGEVLNAVATPKIWNNFFNGIGSATSTGGRNW